MSESKVSKATGCPALQAFEAFYEYETEGRADIVRDLIRKQQREIERLTEECERLKMGARDNADWARQTEAEIARLRKQRDEVLRLCERPPGAAGGQYIDPDNREVRRIYQEGDNA